MSEFFALEKTFGMLRLYSTKDNMVRISITKETMEMPAAYKYSLTSVVVFGILGNILVIISILRQKKLLMNNYHFVVLHLAICDLGWLVVIICTYVQHEVLLGGKSFKMYCLFFRMKHVLSPEYK